MPWTQEPAAGRWRLALAAAVAIGLAFTSGSTDPECFGPEDNEQCKTGGCIIWVPDICGDTLRPSDRIASRLHGGERWLDGAECARREPTKCGPDTRGCMGWEGPMRSTCFAAERRPRLPRNHSSLTKCAASSPSERQLAHLAFRETATVAMTTAASSRMASSVPLT